jgi:phosphopantothenoylcysteine decarboxylase / phosphopantothenate---cysteine ligase
MGCIVVGVTGGIAAYKAVEVARRFTQLGYIVKVIMTEHATRLVGPATFRAVTGNPVSLNLFEEGDVPMQHISLAQEADLFIVSPATANILAKMAQGLADDLLSTALLATHAPVLVAPAMNSDMYTHPATLANVGKLKERGIHVIGPGCGSLACGDEGEGRMVEPEDIVEAGLEILGISTRLTGLIVLVTAGGTREPIDPVRFIANRSSGKMGYALAETATHMGAQVTLVSGPTNLEDPPGVELVKVSTAEEMRREVMARAPDCCVVIMAAAVADFTPRKIAAEKIKKEGRESLTLELAPTVDILKELGEAKRQGQLVVGFAAETASLLDRARAKMADKNLDLLVANDVSGTDTGFDSDNNRAAILYGDGTVKELDLMPKRDLAEHIWGAVRELLDGRS